MDITIYEEDVDTETVFNRVNDARLEKLGKQIEIDYQKLKEAQAEVDALRKKVNRQYHAWEVSVTEALQEQISDDAVSNLGLAIPWLKEENPVAVQIIKDWLATFNTPLRFDGGTWRNGVPAFTLTLAKDQPVDDLTVQLTEIGTMLLAAYTHVYQSELTFFKVDIMEDTLSEFGSFNLIFEPETQKSALTILKWGCLEIVKEDTLETVLEFMASNHYYN